MAVKKPPPKRPAVKRSPPKPKPLTTAQLAGINNKLATKQIYGDEKSPYKSLPDSQRVGGHLTGGHHVTLQAWTVALQVTALLGPDGGRLTGGFGAWEQVGIPRNQALTQWQGEALRTMDLDLLINDWGRQRTVEPVIAKLIALGRRLPGMLTPPSVRVHGAVAGTGARWVINGYDWGDSLRSFSTGQRLRQAVTVHLMEYREDLDLIALPRGTATAKPPRKYVVKRGDDLKKIAARMLGGAAKWPTIAKANKGMRGFKLGGSWVGKTILVPAG